MLCLRQCGQRLHVDEMDLGAKSHVVLGAGRITRTCMFYNNEEAGQLVTVIVFQKCSTSCTTPQ